MLEIIIQGRGGQGAQTAGNLLAQAFFREDQAVQCFASYGGARRGNPVSSVIRTDDKAISLRCDVERADAILCFDSSLLDSRLLQRAEWETLIVVNSAGSREDLLIPAQYQVFQIDALAIAQENNLGRFVNSALLGAFCCLLGTPAIATMSDTILAAAPVKAAENAAACQAGFEAARSQFAGNVDVPGVAAK
jgi:2-oxoacid:acceptor oxidoreductase gamma subunit (pyruvate/2-ketoisovalerate family)